ncbi:MarR family winged helix-turn-helix transcriptional regulator [Nocardia thailandica]|uniref:MarR family winged helix-turn-helix transcriptional regulator n=1 Tax=Nocardia thailandica TaxID=257275 RepID=UPI00031932E5|nr:MarR family transcriptional regulator [Nocardia thailandica]
MEEPRWLDAEEREAWLTLVALAMRLFPALDAQLKRDAGMTHYDYQVLAVLSAAPRHTLRMSVLAASTEGSLPRLSQVVGRLEKLGWVRRTPDPDDGRSTLAVLTAAGVAELDAAAPGHVARVRQLVIDPLTRGQLRQLSVAGQRILRAVDAAEGQHRRP